jgi:hypothetical protein
MREVLRFAQHFLAVVCIPGLLAVALVIVVGWRSGATFSPVEIARMQAVDPMLLWSGDGRYYLMYKTALAEQRHSDIVMLGHSRGGQMRSMMFKPYAFTNGSITAWTIDQLRFALDNVTRRHRLKVAMFNLDYFMLNAAYRDNWAEKSHAALSWTDRDYFDGLINLSWVVKAKPLTMLQRLPIALFSQVREAANGLSLIGPQAIASDGGFRSDGSALYDPVRRNDAPAATHELGRLIPTVPIGTGKHLDMGEAAKLRDLANLAKERGVVLVGIQLPYFKMATDLLDSGRDSGGYRGEDTGIWREFSSPETKAMFEDMGILFYDLSRHPTAADPRGFIDIAHPSEAVTLAALIDMFKDPKMRAVLPDVDISRLEGTLNDAMHRQMFFDVYGSQF